ncbi:MAG: hypothetical protein ACYC9O_07730 [Candidatus Latescibacterota bacterium]
MNISFWKKTPGLVRVLLVFFVSYIILSSVFLMSTPRITGWMLPLYTYIIEHTYPENKLISIENRGESIMYHMEIHKYIQGVDLPLVDTLVDSMHSSFQFVTLIIYYSLLFAWPTLASGKKVIAFFASLPVLILFMLIDIPITIISSIDLATIQKLRGVPLAESFPRKVILFLSHFINNGGRQFFAVALFMLTVLPFRFTVFARKSVSACAGKRAKRL